MRHWTVRAIVVALAVTLIAAAIFIQRSRPSLSTVIERKGFPSTAATTQASSPATTQTLHETAYLDVVRAAYADFSTTQPLGFPLDLSQAAHLILPDPIYLSPAPFSEMWITRDDAAPTTQVLKEAVDPRKDVDVHIVRERVVYVHRAPAGDGTWPPNLVCRSKDGGFDAISANAGRRPLPPRSDYHWELAFSWNQLLVVPTDRGISLLHLGPKVVESHHDFAIENLSPAARLSTPRAVFDGIGLLCWMPWEPGKVGGKGAFRFVPGDGTGADAISGQWTELTPEMGWPARIVHLAPLIDRTVLTLEVDENDAVKVNYNTLERPSVNEKDVAALVEKLSDSDQKIRKDAYDTLRQYGSGIWPILEKLYDDQGPEAQTRLRQILKQRTAPTLNGMVLLGKKTLQLVSRLSDGGTVFFAEAGVSMPDPDNPDDPPDYRVPAYISLRPGRPFELLPADLTKDLAAGSFSLEAVGNDWVLNDRAEGPRRFVGDGFDRLLRGDEKSFRHFAGVDRRGRWLFQKLAPAAAATQPTAAQAALVIDPTLPDPTPRLPVWVFRNAETVGWTKDNWPAVKTTHGKDALHESGWVHLDESQELIATMPPPPTPASRPATASSPTTASTQPLEDALLVDAAGNRYYDGLQALRMISTDGREIVWPLPATSVGSGPVWLIEAGRNRLFLVNQPGRILRIKRTDDSLRPFVLEKTFSHNIPTVDHPARVWLDPAGRIIMACDNQLAIMFPGGYIPPAIVDLMRPDSPDDDEEQ